MSSSRKQNKKKVNRGRIKGGRDVNTARGSGTGYKVIRYILPKGGKICPDHFVSRLTYKDTAVHTNVGFNNSQWRYRNSGYDPDPALGTGALAGFAELATLYTSYRVLRIEYEIVAYNMETFPVQIACAPLALDPGANALTADNIDELPYSQTGHLSSKGGIDQCSLVGVLDFGKFLGIPKQYDQELNYSSAVTTNPVSQLYLAVAYSAANGAAFTAGNGCPLTIKLEYVIEFFARQELNS
jgi:hypothetical protein